MSWTPGIVLGVIFFCAGIVCALLRRGFQAVANKHNTPGGRWYAGYEQWKINLSYFIGPPILMGAAMTRGYDPAFFDPVIIGWGFGALILLIAIKVWPNADKI